MPADDPGAYSRPKPPKKSDDPFKTPKNKERARKLLREQLLKKYRASLAFQERADELNKKFFG